MARIMAALIAAFVIALLWINATGLSSLRRKLKQAEQDEQKESKPKD